MRKIVRLMHNSQEASSKVALSEYQQVRRLCLWTSWPSGGSATLPVCSSQINQPTKHVQLVRILSRGASRCMAIIDA